LIASPSSLEFSSALTKQSEDHGKLLLVVSVSFLIIILLVILMIFVYKKLLNQHQCPEQDSVPENAQDSFHEIDLDCFDIENFDSLAPWERNAHIWINEQILSIKNENFEQ